MASHLGVDAMIRRFSIGNHCIRHIIIESICGRQETGWLLSPRHLRNVGTGDCSGTCPVISIPNCTVSAQFTAGGVCTCRSCT